MRGVEDLKLAELSLMCIPHSSNTIMAKLSVRIQVTLTSSPRSKTRLLSVLHIWVTHRRSSSA
eukprot:2333400-Rhodomonas_salina.3